MAPVQPLRATVGQDVVLPCHLSPRVDARRLEIWWIRHPSSETVHLYRNGEDQNGEQSRDYRGRTELVRAGLSNGSLDLRLLGLRPSDDGQYVCAVQGVTSYSEAAVDLEVAGVWPGGFRGRSGCPWVCVTLPGLCPILPPGH